MKINLEKIELILCHYVIVIVSIYAVYIFIKFNFQFSPQQMDHPGMIIAFLTSCSLNIVRLKEKIASVNIQRVSAFANMLTSVFGNWFYCAGTVFNC